MLYSGMLEGLGIKEIVKRMGVDIKAIINWLKTFMHKGMAWLTGGVDLFVTVNIIIRLFFSKWNYILWQFNFFDIRLCQNIPTVIK